MEAVIKLFNETGEVPAGWSIKYDAGEDGYIIEADAE